MMHPSYSYVANASQLNGYSGLQSSWGGEYSTYTEAKDTSGNVFHVYNDGKIILAYSSSGKGKGQTWYAGTAAYDAVLAALKRVSATQKIEIEMMVGGGAVTTGGGTTDGTGGVVSWLSDLFSKASTKDEKAQAQRNLEGAANQYGPGIISAVQTLLGNKGSSLSSLQKTLAKKRAAYETTTNAKRKLQLKYEIQALENQIANMQMSAQQAGTQLQQSTGPEKKPFQWWIPVAIVGGLGLVTIIAVSVKRGGGE